MSEPVKIVKPHRKVARAVGLDNKLDLRRFAYLAPLMQKMCHQRHGIYLNAMAVAHPQVDDKDPLRFFVTADGLTVVNPEIVRHSSTTVDSKEGCLSYPDKPKVVVQRWHKCEVRAYATSIIKDRQMFFQPYTFELSGKEAYMYQHEIDHLDGKSIFDEQSEA